MQRSKVDHRKYCQQSSTDDGRQFITLSVRLCRTGFTTLATIDVQWRNLIKSRAEYKVPEGSKLIFEDVQISLQRRVDTHRLLSDKWTPDRCALQALIPR